MLTQVDLSNCTNILQAHAPANCNAHMPITPASCPPADFRLEMGQRERCQIADLRVDLQRVLLKIVLHVHGQSVALLHCNSILTIGH